MYLEIKKGNNRSYYHLYESSRKSGSPKRKYLGSISPEEVWEFIQIKEANK